MIRVAACVLCAVLSWQGESARAQSWPAKPVRIVVAFPAGGPTDLLARVLGQKLAEGFGQPVVVENRSGAGGNVGAEVAAKSSPDGHTLFLATISLAINPSLYRRTGYDAVRDFAPVTLVSSTPYVMLVHPSVPARSVKELVALARVRRGELNYASSGNGTAAHLAGELFVRTAGVDIVHVPYKGAAPALTDLLAGQVSLLFNNPLTALPHVRSGKARALAVTSARRATAAPDIPTLAEAGVPGVEVGSWSALLAPAGTPREIVARVNQETLRIVSGSELRQRLASEGADPIGAGPDELAAFIRSELARWAKVVAAAGVKIE